ncbi:MAG: hypothetical protein IJZ87_07510 [Bacteroidales bacterium]|nr:hypothetical protein [Bacteroidales bacterium]
MLKVLFLQRLYNISKCSRFPVDRISDRRRLGQKEKVTGTRQGNVAGSNMCSDLWSKA